MNKMTAAERNVMDLFWEQGALTAKEAAKHLLIRQNWSKTTSYTMLSNCIRKGFLQRQDPGYLCSSLVTREAVTVQETQELLDRNYGGSGEELVRTLIRSGKLSAASLEKLLQSLK